jgi:hypothetical protein
MRNVNQPSDEELVSAFLDCRLSRASFDHHGHLRVAWLLLQRHPLDESIELICSGIARLAAHLGVPDQYNRTLSEALVRLMSDAMTELGSWESFLLANPMLVANVRGLLARYYTHDRLFSAEAKHRFLAPDLQPLP